MKLFNDQDGMVEILNSPSCFEEIAKSLAKLVNAFHCVTGSLKAKSRFASYTLLNRKPLLIGQLRWPIATW